MRDGPVRPEHDLRWAEHALRETGGVLVWPRAAAQLVERIGRENTAIEPDDPPFRSVRGVRTVSGCAGEDE